MIGEIFETLMEFLLESAIEGSKSSKVPKPVRIILKVIVIAVYAALIGLFLLIAFVAFRDGDTGMGIFMLVLTILFTVVFIVKVLRVKKRK